MPTINVARTQALSPPDNRMVDRSYIENKCDHLVAAGFWPREQELRYRAWLSNFTDKVDVTAAATILDRFVFINQDHAGLAVSSGYARFLGHLHDQRFTSQRTPSRIRSLHQQTHFTAIRGESPNPAESGNAYMRVARETLDVSEERIHEIEDAIDICAAGHPLVLLDDFSGTANQVINTITTQDRSGRTLSRLLANGKATIGCITAVMTSDAIDRLSAHTSGLLIFPGYVATVNDYSLDALLPEDRFPAVHSLLSDLAPHFSSAGVDPIRGMNSLGLLLGVHDRIPDASLPILWAEGKDDWIPLKRRKT